MKHLFTLNPLILKYKSKLIAGILFISLSNIFRIFQPQAIREALDEIVAFVKLNPEQRNGEELISNLMYFGLIVLGCALMMGIFMYFMRQTIIVMSRLIEYDQRKEIFDHYLSLDAGFYKKFKIGDVMSRISEDVNKVRMYLGPAFLYGFNLITLFIIVIVTMFKVNFWLSVYTLLPLPLLSFIIYKVSNLINKRSEKIQRQLARLTSMAQEAFSGIRIIKSFNREENWKQKFDLESNRYKDLSLELNRVEALFFPSMFLLIGLSTLITIYVGGLDVFKGTVTPGNIAEFVIYINMLTWPVSAIGWCASIIQQAEASQKRINEFLNLSPQVKTKIQADKFPEPLDINFDHVSFHYPENEIEALKEISFSLPHGKHIAIVGKTASGKSTIAELLVRMYDPNSGAISIGGNDIRNLDLIQLRKAISYVPQDVFLFSDTIAANILFGEDNHVVNTMEKIQRASEAAAIDKEIESFSNQYQTIMGERGVTLSGGQKQRISLARALMKPASIFILDDCLSAVDANTEEHILRELNQELQNKSLILISHRLSQTKEMDEILVIDHHRIVERGNFEELIEAKGLFWKMYQTEIAGRNEDYLIAVR
ncbi:MAG: ABC transporter ATP-binding protein [Saprospiraceae bacterium]|nr:ABC transporter ATP-binding protein [Candidatus Vicinibacter proximus]MCC6844210.1 ABC transporter ATP-binding protein [Saprospiraceae bacterium]